MDGQTDIQQMLLAAEAHHYASELGRCLAWLMTHSDWGLGEIGAATGLRPDTIAAVLHDYGFIGPII